MIRRPIGRTGVAVTEIGFGAASIGNLGHAIDDDTAAGAVAGAWDAGIRYFDTAPHYGLGLSERRLGAALATRPRSEFVVSTKVGRLLEPNPAPTGRDADFDVPDTLRRRFDFTADGVRRSLESSLDRLRMDRVEIVYVHDPDTTEAVEAVVTKALPALARWRDEGVADAIGVGVNRVSVALRLVREAAVDVIMIAGRWTLLDRSADRLLAESFNAG
ncbi:Aldo/keto reductase family protein [Lentzea albidocapillata subsp. violacea]|uniref:Aldo/keto reductase family protein n=1 Tax=Lentzea albidocapillata subsp. violacea TaxID=128104 RepID=A0A1G8YLL8_9PSEU|nr:aldo/keto reductase [Lentzea albidocapillata]SDK03055.1 Aldo/keto reductase family protein [Lentzea albidocapillata subsp. violacea]